MFSDWNIFWKNYWCSHATQRGIGNTKQNTKVDIIKFKPDLDQGSGKWESDLEMRVVGIQGS